MRVLSPTTRRESWTVLGDDGPVVPIERYLAYLADIERSPNIVKAYAHDLNDWFVFLAGHGLDWREIRLEDVAGSTPRSVARRRSATSRGAGRQPGSTASHFGNDRPLLTTRPDRPTDPSTSSPTNPPRSNEWADQRLKITILERREGLEPVCQTQSPVRL